MKNMKLIKKVYRKDLAGKQVYPNWRLDKNLSWFNINSLFFGFIYAHITLMFLWKPKNYLIIINPFGTKYWLPPRYANNYYEAKYV